MLDFLSVATVLMPETLMDLAAIIDYTKEAALLSPVQTKLKKLLTVFLLFIYLFLMWNNISWSISNKRWIFLLSPGQSSALSSVPLHAYISPPSVSIVSSAHFLSFPCVAFFNNQYDTHKDRVQEIRIVRTFLF